VINHIFHGEVVNVNKEENVVVTVIVQTMESWLILIVVMEEIIGFVFLFSHRRRSISFEESHDHDHE
jgi:hypothetical protein